MNKNKLALKIIVFGFMTLQYSFIAKSQDTTKYLAKNDTKNQTI